MSGGEIRHAPAAAPAPSNRDVAHRRYKLVCKLQTLAAPETSKEMIFKGRTLFLGQSTTTYTSTISSGSPGQRPTSIVRFDGFKRLNSAPVEAQMTQANASALMSSHPPILSRK
jgi:hypothetical protein